MTVNGVMAVILRYFSEFAYLPGVLCKSSRSLSHLLMSSCTCHPHVYPHGMIHLAFTRQPQSITALWPVLICRPAEGAEGRRLSRHGWIGEILKWITRPKMVAHPSGGRESNSRPSSRKSNALLDHRATFCTCFESFHCDCVTMKCVGVSGICS